MVDSLPSTARMNQRSDYSFCQYRTLTRTQCTSAATDEDGQTHREPVFFSFYFLTSSEKRANTHPDEPCWHQTDLYLASKHFSQHTLIFCDLRCSLAISCVARKRGESTRTPHREEKPSFISDLSSISSTAQIDSTCCVVSVADIL